MRITIVFLLFFIFAISFNAFAMEEEKYFSEKKLSSYSTIVINDFDIKNVEIDHIDTDEMKELEPMMPTLVKGISEVIQKKLSKEKKFETIQLNGKQSINAVRVEGKILKLSGGIGGVKWLLWPLAPKSTQTYISISGRLVEAETGKELATFADTNTGKMWYKNFAKYFPEMSEELGESVAEFIINNY